ncbi:pol polyprotein, partial [Walleye epidermal hyperplasia virus 1]
SVGCQGAQVCTNREAEILVKVNNTIIPMLVDTGACLTAIGGSAPIVPKLKLTDTTAYAVGISSDPVEHIKTEQVKVKVKDASCNIEPWFNKDQTFHILGRDTLTKMRAMIAFLPCGRMEVVFPARYHQNVITDGAEAKWSLQQFPESLWASSPTDIGKMKITPIHIEVLPVPCPSIRQYPLPKEKVEGLRPMIHSLLAQGVLTECHSSCNTPIFPIKKPGREEYRMIHDLRAINEIVAPLTAVVASPTTVLANLSPDMTCFTVIDLSNAFFSVPIHPDSQYLFAFTFEGRQYTWTVLPQGFIHSPTLFSQALFSSLSKIKDSLTSEICIYMDDVLIASKDEETNYKDTATMLHHLADEGHKVSKKKLQLCKSEVVYLGQLISKAGRDILPERKKTVSQFAAPTTVRQVRAFLGLAGYCRHWIADYSENSKHLEELLKKEVIEPFTLTGEQLRAFEQLKSTLLSAPVLAIPDYRKDFELYTSHTDHVAVAVLAQKQAGRTRPIAFLSAKLDAIEQGLPPCLRACASIHKNLTQADSFLLGRPVKIYTTHSICTLLQRDRSQLVTASRFSKWEADLLRPELTFVTCTAVSPAHLLATATSGDPPHDCVLLTHTMSRPRSDLSDVPLEKPELILFTDGSYSKGEGGCAVVQYAPEKDTFLTVAACTGFTSAQTAELAAITLACQYAEDKSVNIYTDSRYAFGVLHDFGHLWQHRGFVTSAGTPIKNHEMIQKLLEAVQLPSKISLMKCPAHTKGVTLEIRGNAAADEAAKKAVSMRQGVLKEDALEETMPSLSMCYDLIDEKYCEDRPQGQGVFWHEDLIIPPVAMLPSIMRAIHGVSHTHKGGMMAYFKKLWFHPLAAQAIDEVIAGCVVCLKHNPKYRKRKDKQGHRPLPGRPFSHLQVDFVHMSDKKPMYALVIVDVLSKWPEVFSCNKEDATTVCDILMTDILPRWGLPDQIDSDQGTHFTSKITQQLANSIGVAWKLHCPGHPQSSGMVERLNRTIKTKIEKVKTHLQIDAWHKALPYVLMELRAIPKKNYLSPYEIVMGRPMKLDTLSNVSPLWASDTLVTYMNKLTHALSEYHTQVANQWPTSVLPPGPEPGTWCMIKSFTKKPTVWEGPHLILLSTPTAVKVEGKPTWVHLDFCKLLPSSFSSPRDEPEQGSTPNTTALERKPHTPSPRPSSSDSAPSPGCTMPRRSTRLYNKKK